MPQFLRKFIGLLLLFATIGIVAVQAMLVSCSSNGTALSSVLLQ